ncbi:MAG: PAS domain S-box protein [Phycisphaeraceae bacterium]
MQQFSDDTHPLPGGGGMGDRIRSFDWSKTPLGPIARWPQPLRSIVNLAIETRFPSLVAWGTELTVLYNDAYRPLLGDKPEALGRPLFEVWAEIRDTIEPLIEQAQAGEAVFFEDFHFTLLRHGYPEPAWFDFCFSPLRNQAGAPAGVLVTAVETTGEVVAERRRQGYLLKLADQLRDLADPARAQFAAARLLGQRLEASRVFYAEFDPDTGDFAIPRDYCRNVPSLAGQPGWANCVRAFLDELHDGRVVTVSDCRADPRLDDPDRAVCTDMQVRAAVLVPLLRRNRLSAALVVQQAERREWTAPEVDLAQETAKRTWEAVERARAEQAVRELQAQYRILVEEVTEAVWETDPEGRIVTDSPSWRAFTGQNRDEWLNQGWIEAIHPDDRDQVQERWQEAIRERRQVNAEFRVRRTDGAWRWMNVLATPMLADDGAVRKWLGMNIDVTERKQTELALRESEERFKQMADTAPAMLWVTDEKHQCVFLSRGWHEYTGQTEAEGLGLGWSAAAHREDQDQAGEAFLRAAEQRDTYRGEYRLRTARGEYRWVIDSGRPRFGPDGTFLGYIGSVIDIHDRKQSEQQLEQAHALLEGITEGTKDLIAAEDSEFRFQYFNNAYCEEFRKLWGREPELGESMLDLLAPWPEEQRKAAEMWGRALAGESFSVTARFGPSEADQQVYDLRFSPIRDDQGRLVGAAHILRNVTDRVRTQEALQQARDQLEQRVAERTSELQHQTVRLRNLAHELAAAEHRERKRLAALLHDELQQFLVAAKMRLVGVRSSEDTELAASLSGVGEMIDRAADASRDLTRQLRPPVLYEDGLVPALRWLAGELEELHGLRVETDAEEAELPLNDDVKALLFESIRELLFNVVKHAGVDQAAVRVGQRDGELEITVEDHGVGFDLGALERSSAEQGLGLFSIRERLAALGGALSAASSPDTGTRIELRVPLTPSDEEQAAIEAEQASPVRPRRPLPITRTDRHVARVLVVDDHAIVRQGIANVLSSDQRLAVVAEAADGLEAIEAVDRHRPDVVVIDVNMPRMNGIEATREIRRRWPEVRVVGLSVQDDEATAGTMRDAGAAAFISKSDDARRMIDAVLDSRTAV